MTPSGERAAYRRVPGLALEAMDARFERYAYPTHAHDTYSFGVTDAGAQAFVCRGGRHVSAAGLVMAFNPDDPHDGRPAVDDGYRYRMLHLGEDLVRDVLTDAAPATTPGLPLFTAPVLDDPALDDPALARTLTRLHTAVTGAAPCLLVEERLTAAVLTLTRHAATRTAPSADGRPALGRAREVLRERFAENVTADELARAAGCSRFALYRGFRAAYGFAPSDYQRDLRLRRARALLAAGTAPSTAAAEAGFADQAHLTRWFTRTYGVTPAVYRAG